MKIIERTERQKAKAAKRRKWVKRSEREERRKAQIVALLNTEMSYNEIATQFNISSQRVEQIRKQGEKKGITFRERARGRRKWLCPTTEQMIAILQDNPDKSYEQLSKGHGFTQGQLKYAYSAAVQRGMDMPRRYRGGAKRKLICNDLKNADLRIKEIAEKHNTSAGSIAVTACRLRKEGIKIPYRGRPSLFIGQSQPWYSKRRRTNIERSILDGRLSISEIAKKHKVTTHHVEYVIRKMRESGKSVPKCGRRTL